MGTEPSKSIARDASLWQVMVGPAGCLMTREELTAALERDDVHRSTLVRRPGAIRWTTARQGLGLPRTEHDRSLEAELPNLPPPLETRTRKKSTSPDKRTWRPTAGTLFGMGVLAFVSGAVLATSTASLTRSFDRPKAQDVVAVSPVVASAPVAPASIPAPAAPPSIPPTPEPAQTAAPVVVSAVPAPAPTPHVESTSARAALLKPPPPIASAKKPQPRAQRAPHAPPASAAAGRKHAPLRSAAKPAAPPPRKATIAKQAPRTKAAPSRKAKRR